MTSTFLRISGLQLGCTAAGIRYKGRNDLVAIELQPGSTGAAVFTRNAFCAAPVVVAREHLAATAPRYLLINSGNANAGTGDAGLSAARKSCELLAKAAGCRPNEVLPFSTGVTGPSRAPSPVGPPALACGARPGPGFALSTIGASDPPRLSKSPNNEPGLN